jgi:hypothetical protein
MTNHHTPSGDRAPRRRAAQDEVTRRRPTGGGPPAPRYPQVRIRLGGGDGPAGILIGKVAVALRYRVGDQAADTFNAAAHACTTRDQLLRLIRATVRAR